MIAIAYCYRKENDIKRDNLSLYFMTMCDRLNTNPGFSNPSIFVLYTSSCVL